MRIGIAITTTPDRLDLFRHTWDVWDQYKPDNAVLTYVNDQDGAGVARAKNSSLKLLESLGVTHYFLVDNDTVPISKEWYKPFIESKESHLLYNFKMPNKGKNDMRVEYEDDNIVSYSHTRGCFIYVTQDVLDTVGGMDTRYKNGFEHADWTTRIYNAGLTTHRSMSPVGADKLLYCLDQDQKIESSIKLDYKTKRDNYRLYNANRNSREWMPYK